MMTFVRPNQSAPEVAAMPDQRPGSGGPRNVPLSDASKRKAAGMLDVLDMFVAIRGDMPVQYMRAYLMVALREGQGVTWYAEQAGVSKSVMSRHLHDIGDEHRTGKEGYGLVIHRQHPTTLRAVEVWLTPKGRALWHRIERRLEEIER